MDRPPVWLAIAAALSACIGALAALIWVLAALGFEPWSTHDFLELLRIVVSWPSVTLLLAVLVLYRFGDAIVRLLDRTKKLRIAGVEMEADAQARNLALTVGPDSDRRSLFTNEQLAVFLVPLTQSVLFYIAVRKSARPSLIWDAIEADAGPGNAEPSQSLRPWTFRSSSRLSWMRMLAPESLQPAELTITSVGDARGDTPIRCRLRSGCPAFELAAQGSLNILALARRAGPRKKMRTSTPLPSSEIEDCNDRRMPKHSVRGLDGVIAKRSRRRIPKG
jgi:hypothetical protein